MIENGNKNEKKIAENIFKDIGIYLGYTIPLYSHFYDFQDLLVLGRVVSGEGGNIIVEKAKEVTTLGPAKTYPETPVEQTDGCTSKLLSSCD